MAEASAVEGIPCSLVNLVAGGDFFDAIAGLLHLHAYGIRDGSVGVEGNDCSVEVVSGIAYGVEEILTDGDTQCGIGSARFVLAQSEAATGGRAVLVGGGNGDIVVDGLAG